MITLIDDARSKPKRLIVQVKSGKVKSGDIRDLVGTIEREKAPIGVFITLEPPTKDMKSEAASAGFYHSPNWNKDYPRLQILTVEELLSGAEVRMPPTATTYKKAQRERQQQGEQQQFVLIRMMGNTRMLIECMIQIFRSFPIVTGDLNVSCPSASFVIIEFRRTWQNRRIGFSCQCKYRVAALYVKCVLSS